MGEGTRDAAPTPAIQTLDLVKRYGAVTALAGLTMTVAAGEVFGFLGPNGAGKTTAVKLLLGLTRPTAGEAWLLGAAVGDRETRRQIVLYTLLLTFLTLLPVVFGFFGAIYGVLAAGLGAAFIVLSLRLQRRADRRSALRAYLFSLAYLAALFAAMVLDARI